MLDLQQVFGEILQHIFYNESITASEKLTIIKYAEACGNRAAERQFDGD